jgi:hypothetical protein
VDATNPPSSGSSLEDILFAPVPEHPTECAASVLILRMLANGVPLLLLPDVAWPGRIPADREETVTSATVTGPIGIVGGTSAARSATAAVLAGTRAAPDYVPHEAGFSEGQQAC